jgi:hypothetical protein
LVCIILVALVLLAAVRFNKAMEKKKAELAEKEQK